MPQKKSKRSKYRRPLEVAVATNCPFCASKINPDYKKWDDLKKYVTDRGKIVGRKRSGICAKHQRRLAIAIKRARFIGLLPYTSGL